MQKSSARFNIEAFSVKAEELAADDPRLAVSAYFATELHWDEVMLLLNRQSLHNPQNHAENSSGWLHTVEELCEDIPCSLQRLVCPKIGDDPIHGHCNRHGLREGPWVAWESLRRDEWRRIPLITLW